MNGSYSYSSHKIQSSPLNSLLYRVVIYIRKIDIYDLKLHEWMDLQLLFPDHSELSLLVGEVALSIPSGTK